MRFWVVWVIWMGVVDLVLGSGWLSSWGPYRQPMCLLPILSRSGVQSLPPSARGGGGGGDLVGITRCRAVEVRFLTRTRPGPSQVHHPPLDR